MLGEPVRVKTARVGRSGSVEPLQAAPRTGYECASTVWVLLDEQEGHAMGIGDMMDKGKDALSNAMGDEQKSDDLLDKGEGFANDRLAGHEDQIAKGRDALDDRVGDGQ